MTTDASRTDRPIHRELQQLGGAMAVSMLLGLVGRLLVPRALGPSAFGAYRLAEASADLVLVLLSLGLDSLLRRDIARTPAGWGSHLWPVIAFRATLGLVVVVGGLAILAVTDTAPDVVLLFAVLGVGQVCAALTNAAQAAQQALGRGARVARSLVGMKVLWLAALGLAVLHFPGALMVAVVGAGVEAGRAAVLLFALARETPPQHDGDRLAVRRLLGAAWPFALNAVAHSVYARLGVWRLGEWGTSSEVGLYGAATQLGAVALAGVPLLFSVVLPAAARDADRADHLYATVLRLAVVMLVPVAALVTMTAPLWTHVVLGDAYRLALPALYWQAPTVVLTYVASIAAMALLTRGDAVRVAKISGAGVLVGVVANVLMIPASALAPGRGAAGAAMAALVTEVFVAALLLRAAWRPTWSVAIRAPWHLRGAYVPVR